MLKRATTALYFAMLCLAALGRPTAEAQTLDPNGAATLLIKLVAGLSTQQQAQVIADNGGVEISSIPVLRVHVIAVSTRDLPAVLAAYQGDPRVASVELEKTRTSESLPSDPLYPYQWALPQIGWDQVFGVDRKSVV